MKLFSLCIILFSFNVFSKCDVLIEPGGWSADGLPGIIEMDFDMDGSVSIHFFGPEPLGVIDTRGSWECINLEILIKFNNENVMATINKPQKGIFWTLEFNNNNVPYLSQRILTPFRY